MLCSLAVLLKNIRLVVAVALMIFVVAYRTVLVHERDAANRRVEALERENASLQTVNESLKNAVSSQNMAIADLRTKTKQAEAHEQAAVVAAAREAGRSQYEIERVLHAQVPPECPEAMRWLATSGAELGKW